MTSTGDSRGIESGTSRTHLLDTCNGSVGGQGTVPGDEGVDLGPLFCAFASTAEELDKISEVVASTPWDGDLVRAREGRLSVCGMMGVQMISRPASGPGTHLIDTSSLIFHAPAPLLISLSHPLSLSPCL